MKKRKRGNKNWMKGFTLSKKDKSVIDYEIVVHFNRRRKPARTHKAYSVRKKDGLLLYS